MSKWGASSKVPASTPEEQEKYSKIKWQYSPEWIAENMSKGDPDGSQQQS